MDDQGSQGYLDHILRFYGQNKSISTKDLEDLVQIIAARRPEIIAEDNPLTDIEVSAHLLKTCSIYFAEFVT